MNSFPGDPSPLPGAIPGVDDLPRNWRQAVSGLLSSRLAIFRIEAGQWVSSSIKRIILCIAAGIALLFAWALLVAGGIVALALATGWPWHYVALGAGGAHLLAALILLGISKNHSSGGFPVTAAEFRKDREWLTACPKTPKSPE